MKVVYLCHNKVAAFINALKKNPLTLDLNSVTHWWTSDLKWCQTCSFLVVLGKSSQEGRLTLTSHGWWRLITMRCSHGKVKINLNGNETTGLCCGETWLWNDTRGKEGTKICQVCDHWVKPVTKTPISAMHKFHCRTPAGKHQHSTMVLLHFYYSYVLTNILNWLSADLNQLQ